MQGLPARLGGAIASVVLVTTTAACGQARLAAPPEPEFTSGSRAEPAVPAPPPAVRDDGFDPGPDETDLAWAGADGGSVGESMGESVDVGQMLLVDDAGTAVPNPSGWSAFDTALAGRLIGPSVSASVAVMIDGQLVHRAAFGERVAGGGETVETTDRFRIASISKIVTATVTLQLVDDGVLPLDEPIGQVLIDHLQPERVDPDVAAITVRELLSHTAGLPKHQATFFSNGASSCGDAARRAVAGPVSAGGGYSYANMGYCVLSVLIEAVTGKTYERVVNERLLTPLGISGMRMTSTYDLGPDEVSHHPVPGRNYMETLAGAGSWNATPSDIVTIVNSIDPTTPGWKALAPETMTALRYRVPTGLPPRGYGLGVINYAGDAWGHTGTLENAHSMVLVQPDGVTWAVTVSGAHPSESEALRGIVRSALATAFPA